MRRILLFLVLLLALAGPASAIPALPAEFSGTVSIDGSPAPAGTVITARIDGRDCGTLTLAAAGVYGGGGIYDNRLIINGEDSDAGKTITFLVDGVLAAETSVYAPGTPTDLALTVTKGGSSGSGASGSSSGGDGGGPSGGAFAAPTPTATATEPTASGTPDTGEEGAVRQETPALTATTAPLGDPTLTFGPVVSATAVQQAGLPLSWLAGLAALAGAALFVRARRRE